MWATPEQSCGSGFPPGRGGPPQAGSSRAPTRAPAVTVPATTPGIPVRQQGSQAHIRGCTYKVCPVYLQNVLETVTLAEPGSYSSSPLPRELRGQALPHTRALQWVGGGSQLHCGAGSALGAQVQWPHLCQVGSAAPSQPVFHGFTQDTHQLLKSCSMPQNRLFADLTEKQV